MLHNRHAHKLLILFILLLPCTAVAQEFATDLNGFRLWQYKDTAQTFFGKPFQTQKNDEYSAEAYQVTDSSYMVIEHWEKYPDNIYSIQITRYPTRMLPFKGLVLGDPARKVQDALGKPSRTKKLEKPPVTINYYDKANYSTEIDADGRLYSIKIHVTGEFMNDADDKFDQWAAFKKAILAKDMNAVLELVRPDVEIFKDEGVLSIKKRYEDFRSKPDDSFAKALIGERNSVREELGKTEPEEEMRLAENVGVGRVYKFKKGKILKEIVFFPYNGKYRVYEIAFQGKGGKKKGKTK
jgi:hypothetical protein